jgi:hypothetical protein
MAGAQILRLGRSGKEGIDLPRHEQLDRPDGGFGDPVDVLDVVKADLSGHKGHEHVREPPRACTPTLLPFRSATVRMPSLANNS